ncbi:MAG: hypothetical protein NVSMB13_20200 [Mycobacteriales bacterium]
MLVFCGVLVALGVAGALSYWQVRGRDVSDIDRFANARAVTSGATPARWASSQRPAALLVPTGADAHRPAAVVREDSAA